MTEQSGDRPSDEIIRLVASESDKSAERRKDLAMAVGVPLAAVAFLAIWVVLAIVISILWASIIMAGLAFVGLFAFLGAGRGRRKEVAAGAVDLRPLPKKETAIDLPHRGLGHRSTDG